MSSKLQIDFFEEHFKTGIENKAKLISWNSTIFLAASSKKVFDKRANILKNANKRLSFVWWPTLKSSYWISVFSSTNELVNLNKSIKLDNVMLDLEFPLLKKSLFLNNILSTVQNKKVLNRLIKSPNELYTAQYPAVGKISDFFLEFFGLKLPSSVPHKKIVMLYSSLLKNNPFYKQMLNHFFKTKDIAGIGLLDTGVYHSEPTLSPKDLKKDLYLMKKNQVKRVVIYSLGGLNNEYLKSIKNF